MANFQIPDISKPISDLLKHKVDAPQNKGAILITVVYYSVILNIIGGIATCVLHSITPLLVTSSLSGLAMVIAFLTIILSRKDLIGPAGAPATNASQASVELQAGAIQSVETNTEQQTATDIFPIRSHANYLLRKRLALEYKLFSIRKNRDVNSVLDLDTKFFFVYTN